MARNIDVKKRGNTRRKRKNVYLIIAEGKNKTETLYFSNFQEQGRDFYIHFVKAGKNTDADSLYKTLISKWKEMGLSEAEGDRGFIVLDIDNDELKAAKVNQLISKNTVKGIGFIVSNPAFELWFLLHYRYTTKHFKDGDAVIEDLKKHIPNYDKNVDVYGILEDKMEQAAKNAEKLSVHFKDEKWPSKECNPKTDVGELVKLLQ